MGTDNHSFTIEKELAMKAIVSLLIIFISLTNVLAQTNSPHQALPSGFLFNISPLTVNRETGKTDYAFSTILLTLDVANVADLMFTKRALKSGEVYEANPLMREALRNEPLDWILKLGTVATMNYILKMAYDEDKTGAYIAAVLLGSSYSWLAYRNYRLTIQLGM